MKSPPSYDFHVGSIDASSSGVRVTFTVTKRFMYNAIAHVFKAANIRKASTSTTATSSSNWNIFWGHHLKSAEFSSLLPFQIVNHFPGSFELGRKDRLCSNLLRMRKRHPQAYSGIIPETYLTGNEYDKQQFLTQLHANPHVLWILKPPNLSCGRGIKLVTAASNGTPKLSKKKAYVAQKYIANPFLINELKFDLRIYVLVTSYEPLRIYLFDDGLVRFCTEKYSTSKSALQNPFGHLTNYSVNKKNTAVFQQNQDTGDDDEHAFTSSKWSLKMLYKYMHDLGKHKELTDFQVVLEDLIIKPLLAVESKVLMMVTSTSSGTQNGFELYGFDILLEGDEMKPWLLEVNVFPSLSSSSPMDKRIKTILVSDMFQLVGVPFQDAQSAIQQHDKAKQERLHGVHATRRRASTRNSASAPLHKDPKKKRTVDDLLKSYSQESATCSMELNDDELRTVKEMEEEELRKGHFKRIFPTATSFERYHELFETPRFRNVLCMLWLQRASQSANRRRVCSGKTTNVSPLKPL
uniref:Tubulin--tyrosine ligase-like protein 5 n=1 Tax=Globisporangium ultimum (strain ATCC 200006 / CBS 805.95 / DAOM BR144) TaxID=431595 RepID=K3WHZ6_GLOUD